jgi:hypothetical protein
MHIERRFHIWLWLAAALLAVAIMSAPEYVPLLKEHPGWYFWAGIIGAILCFGKAFLVAYQDEARTTKPGRSRRMIALAGMAISGISLVGFAGAYFWPVQNEQPGTTDAQKTQQAKIRMARRWIALSNDILIDIPSTRPAFNMPRKDQSMSNEVFERLWREEGERGSR